MNVSGCEYLECGMCNAERDNDGYTDCECYSSECSNCYFKQLARETQERDRYRKAFDEIEEIVNIDFSLPCARTDCTYPKPCKDSLTENGTKCMRFALQEIKDIVKKNKEE